MNHAVLVASMCAFLFVEKTIANDVFTSWPTQAEISVYLGAQRVVIPSGCGGLKGQGFPDMPIVVLKQQPLTFFMVCGNDTYLWSGKNLPGAMPVKKVLSPEPTSTFDNNYAGIASVYQDKKSAGG